MQSERTTERRGVMPARPPMGRDNGGGIQALDHRTCRIESGVDEYRAEDRFERIGKNRRTAAPAAAHLTLAQINGIRER